jgi:hypothetical protein
MKALPGWLILLSMASAAPAPCAIFVQRDAGTGAMVYSNVPLGGRDGARRGVTEIVATVAAPAKPVLSQDASFPIISRAEQQQRDLGRQSILNDELDREQQRLSLAHTAGAAPEVQHRHRSNIEALKREIAALR